MSLAEINLAFFAVSILFYCLFAGADFGAGIQELFLGKRRREAQREIISHAIAPVWEANHVWLVLGLVILFNGFPKVYSFISTAFHIPLVLLLVGIVLRGCAFTFRHYDIVKDSTQRYYSAVFVASSVVSPLFLGIIAGGIILGKAPLEPTGFYETFVLPWLNPFCFSLGVFTSSLFAFLAAVYLIGETEDRELRTIFVRRALASNLFAIPMGALVFLTAESSDFHLIARFLGDPISLGCLFFATLLLIPLWKSITRHQIILSRVLAAAQMTFILLGWFKLQYPALASAQLLNQSIALTLEMTAAPEATQLQLLYALLGGSALIFPALYVLLRIFKR